MESLGAGRCWWRPSRVAIGVAILVAKLVVGLLTGSLGIISDAVHSLVDVVASGFALVAVPHGAQARRHRTPYGHGRAENLAAFAEGVLLVITAVGIASRRCGG